MLENWHEISDNVRQLTLSDKRGEEVNLLVSGLTTVMDGKLPFDVGFPGRTWRRSPRSLVNLVTAVSVNLMAVLLDLLSQLCSLLQADARFAWSSASSLRLQLRES